MNIMKQTSSVVKSTSSSRLNTASVSISAYGWNLTLTDCGQFNSILNAKLLIIEKWVGKGIRFALSLYIYASRDSNNIHIKLHICQLYFLKSQHATNSLKYLRRKSISYKKVIHSYCLMLFCPKGLFLWMVNHSPLLFTENENMITILRFLWLAVYEEMLPM